MSRMISVGGKYWSNTPDKVNAFFHGAILPCLISYHDILQIKGE